MLNPDKESENKVLGIPWNTRNDEFVISFRIQKSTEVVETKIDLLKRIASTAGQLLTFVKIKLKKY